jgi:hypothetical protein
MTRSTVQGGVLQIHSNLQVQISTKWQVDIASKPSDIVLRSSIGTDYTKCSSTYLKCQEGKGWDKYHLHDGFLFRADKLCVPDSSIRLLLLQESHMGGLMGHFGREKTYLLLSDHFYWPRMRHDVERFVQRCTTCHMAKSKLHPHGLYTPLPTPNAPWEDISMDFV